MSDEPKYEHGADALRWLEGLISGGQPVSFTLNWVHPKDMPFPPLGHGHGGRLAEVQGFHVILQQGHSMLLAEEACDRLKWARDGAWMDPLRGLQLRTYSMKECLVAAACCARVPHQRWGELAQMLFLRAGRGQTTIEEALAYLGYDSNARAMQ